MREYNSTLFGYGQIIKEITQIVYTLAHAPYFRSLQCVLQQERDCSESLRVDIKINEQSSLEIHDRDQNKIKGLAK